MEHKDSQLQLARSETFKTNVDPQQIGKQATGLTNYKEERNKQLAKTAAPTLNEERDDDDYRHPLRRLAFASTGQVEIHHGRFSWVSACFMCFFVITGFISMVMAVLSMKNTAVPMVAEEISYIDARNPPWDVPPWGFVEQPDDAKSRTIGKPFRFAMPQTTLFYSLASASFGLFTVSYFCSELLVQDLGISRVKLMGDVINKGVDMYIFRTIPVVILFVIAVACVLFFISGLNFVISMLVGASTCTICANMGMNMNFEGAPRLTHALNSDLVQSVQMGIRTGAIGGLSAHAMAQLGVVLVWMVVRDSVALVGFGAGVSIIAFYNRVGGGIFSKGSDIGSDFVSAMMGEDGDDYNMDVLNERRKELMDRDGDGDIDDDAKARATALDPNAYIHDEGLGYITEDEAKLREEIENEMEETLQTMHPVNYLDAIGENIADVGGTSSDLFETMCMTLATAVNFGSRAHDVPYFGTSLPFTIISTGTICCSIVSFWVWSHEKHSSIRIRIAMRLNLIMVMIAVQAVVCLMTFMHWKVWHTISFQRMIYYDIIVLCGLVSPEISAYMCEFFTSINCPPVAWLAANAHLGMIQVILQGLGQGFVSAGVPSVVNILVQIVAFRFEGFYGLTLLACSSQACTGWQATIAAYGAVANNAHRMVFLTTTNEIAHHRAGVCAAVGTTTSHNGKCVAGQNAFFATTSLLGTLLAEKYTNFGKNFQATVGQDLSAWTRAGMLAGIICTMLFLANTLTGCIKMAKLIVTFCKGNDTVMPRKEKTYPATHIGPLKTLVAYASIESFQLTLAPLVQTAAAPLVVGQLFGFKGLLMLVSGGNSVCFALNMFLINSGQAWDAARKYVLFGMLRGEKGEVVSTDSEVYDVLGIGEQIGGPLEDLTGPALNNFIKFVAVISFVTSSMYDEFPDNTWQWGVFQVMLNFGMVSFLKFGLAYAIKNIDEALKRRRDQMEYEEGTTMLREIEAREKQVEQRLMAKKGLDDLETY